MPLADLLEERFKVRTRAVENPSGIISLGVAAQIIFANNPNRLAWIAVNLSSNVIYLALSNVVSATHGIRLNANGGMASMVWDEDFQMTAWGIWAVASAPASELYTLEVVEY
jgi:hypothetical protein